MSSKWGSFFLPYIGLTCLVHPSRDNYSCIDLSDARSYKKAPLAQSKQMCSSQSPRKISCSRITGVASTEQLAATCWCQHLRVNSTGNSNCSEQFRRIHEAGHLLRVRTAAAYVSPELSATDDSCCRLSFHQSIHVHISLANNQTNLHFIIMTFIL